MINQRLAAAMSVLFANHAIAQTNTATSDGVISTQATALKIQSLAKLDNPWAMALLPDGRLLVTEKPGRLRIFANGKLSEPIGGLPKVEHRDQGGLLDVAIDPNFTANQTIYFSYSEAADEQPKSENIVPDPRLGQFVDPSDTVVKGTAVARGRLSGNTLSDIRVIWRQTPKTAGLNHFGGSLVFAPDGKLFITSGDRQRFDPAQDLSGNLGKVVRINADGSVPADNPFVNKPGARPDIWTLGHRNPLGAAIEPNSKALWVHEMGPMGGDEINIIDPGQNYGWPKVSDGDNYDKTPIPRHATDPSYVKPVHSWNPSISPSGLIFYGSDRIPGWRGNALFGGLSSKALFRLTLEDNRITNEERINLDKRIRDVIEDADGSVLLLSDGGDGELLRLSPSDDANKRADSER